MIDNGSIGMASSSTAGHKVIGRRDISQPIIRIRGLDIHSTSGNIESVLVSKSSQNFFYTIRSMSPKTGYIKDEDPETAAMSDKEILAEVRAMFGAWADRDDIDDNWLDDIRSTWDDRLDGLYGPETDTL